MATFKEWWPGTCRGGQCYLMTRDGFRGLIGFSVMCEHHARLRIGLGSDEALYDNIIATDRVRNYAANDVAAELSIEHGAAVALARLDDQDRVIFTVGGSPVRRNRLQTAINTRVGAGKVIVE